MSEGIFQDLLKQCKPLREEHAAGKIRRWHNIHTPGARQRKIDLLVGPPIAGTNDPDLHELRICVENKSVVTAHRNRDERFDDLDEVLHAIHAVKPEGVKVATVMVGVAERVLNVPDRVKPFFKYDPKTFTEKILPRLSGGDENLFKEFPMALSQNKPGDPEATVAKFRSIRTRPPSRTDIEGYDFVYLVPVTIDNVHPPKVARENTLGLDVDRDYERMLETICKAYTSRWHW